MGTLPETGDPVVIIGIGAIVAAVVILFFIWHNRNGA